MRTAEIKNSTYIEINLQKANSSDIAEVTLFNQIKLNFVAFLEDQLESK